MKLKYYIYSFIASMMLIFSACSPEEFDLGAKSVTPDDLAEGIAYTITHDSQNPNIVYLESKLGDNYTALWEHPQGRSQAKKVTLKMAFDGTYSVTFGVETRGGVVYGEPTTFKIDDFCADFVTGDMWQFLAGGAGSSKTWVPDNGNYGMKQGFYSCFDPSATYKDMVSDNGTNWYAKDKTWWEPANAEVDITADDLNSYMTFSLEGKAGLTVHRFTNGQETVTEGLFSMNTDEHTMSAVDVDFVHGAWATKNAVDFRNGFQVLVLTENQLMIANYRDPVLSGEGKCIYCWNFVSKEYADNYKAPIEDNTDVVPELPDGWQDDVTQIKNQKIVWKLSADSPFDWCDLLGNRKNGFAKIGDYKEWCTPAADVSDITLTLNSKVKSYKLELPDFTIVEGTYSLSSDGLYTFDRGLSSYLIGSDWIYFGADESNQLRLVDYEMSTAGPVSDMWLGVKQKDGNGKPYQYLAYHFVAQSDTKQEVIYEAAMSLFDNGSWARLDGTATNVINEGTYTVKIAGALSSIDHTGTYGCYIDIPLILKDHPNATFSVVSIAADGNNVTYDASLIDTTGAGDLPTTARLQLKNAWGTGIEIPDFTTSLEVTFSVAFND